MQTGFFMSCVLLTLPCSAAAAIDPAELQAIAARKALKTGEVQVESMDYRLSSDGKEFVPSRAVQFTLSFEGGKIRTSRETSSVSADGKRKLFDKEIALRQSKRTYLRGYNLDDKDAVLAVQFASIQSPKAWLKYRQHIVDARLMGLEPIPFGILHSCQYEDFVGNPTRSAMKAEDSSLDNKRVRHVTFQKQDYTYSMWISLDEGWNPIQLEVIAPDKIKSTMKVEVKKFGNIFFPQRIVYEHFDKEGKLIDKNIATVKQAAFNVEMPIDRFYPKSLDPAIGSLFFDVDEPGKVIGQWDGRFISPLPD